MIEDKSYFSHSDKALCSLLLYFGHNVEFIEKENGKGIFYFKRTKGLDSLIEAYWARRPMELVPSALFEVSKHLMAMVN